MDASNRTPTTKQLPVAPGVDEKRRRRSVQERRKIFEETLAPEASVARVARAHGVNVNQVFSWRLYRRGRLGGAIAAAAVRPSERTGGAALVPVTLSDAPVERAPVRARSLYAGEAFGVELDHTIYAPDSTTIDLCLSLCPGPRSRTAAAQLNSTPCSTCAAPSPASSASPTGASSMSAHSTICFMSPAPSTSWTAPIWTSADCTRRAASHWPLRSVRRSRRWHSWSGLNGHR